NVPFHDAVDALAVVGMNGFQKGSGPIIETLASSTPNLFVCGTDEEHAFPASIDHPEDAVDIFRKLAEAAFGLLDDRCQSGARLGCALAFANIGEEHKRTYDDFLVDERDRVHVPKPVCAVVGQMDFGHARLAAGMAGQILIQLGEDVRQAMFSKSLRYTNKRLGHGVGVNDTEAIIEYKDRVAQGIEDEVSSNRQ